MATVTQLAAPQGAARSPRDLPGTYENCISCAAGSLAGSRAISSGCAYNSTPRDLPGAHESLDRCTVRSPPGSERRPGEFGAYLPVRARADSRHLSKC